MIAWWAGQMWGVQDQSPRGVARTLKEQAASAIAARDLTAAAEAYQRLTVMEPTDAMARLRYGRVLVSLGRVEEAVAAYREAIDLFRNGGDYRQASAVCSVVLSLRPHNPEALHLKASLRLPIRATLRPMRSWLQELPERATPDVLGRVALRESWAGLDLEEGEDKALSLAE